MVKFGNIKCEKCGAEVNKKKIKLHKCVKVDTKRLEKCSSCGKEVPFNNFSAHYKSCRARGFWKLHLPFFLFFLRAIRSFNRELKKIRYLGCKEAQKRLVEEQTFVPPGKKPNLKENKSLLVNVAKVEEEEALKGVKKAAEEEELNFDMVDNLDAIKDSVSYSSPGLSARQIIFVFLKNKGIEDSTTIELIDKKLFNRDYPTDEELQENPYLFKKIQKLRVQYDYKLYFEKFYYMLVGYYENRDTYKCHYCGKFYMQMKKHMKRCQPYRTLFYGHEEEAILFFLRTFFKADYWSQERIDYYVNYYKNYSLNYFVETINEHVRHRRAFIDRILEGRRKFREQEGYAYHYSFRALLAEIDAWHPPCFEEPPKETKSEKEERDAREKYFKDLNNYFDPDYKDEENSIFDRFQARIDKGAEEEESQELISSQSLEEEKEPDEAALRKTWLLLLGDKFKKKQEKKEELEEESSCSEEEDGLVKLTKNAVQS